MHIFFLLILTTYLSSMPVEVTDKNMYETLSHFTYTEVLDYDESPLDLKDREWKKSTDEFTVLNKEHQTYWIKFQIHNNTSNKQELYLLDERRYVFSLKFFLIKDDEIIKRVDDGYIVNENHSEFSSSLRIFSLTVDGNSSVDVLMKIQNFNQLDTPYRLVTKEYLMEYVEQYHFLQGMFFAIILIMGIYNFIIYFILKYKLYLYHVVYTVLLLLYQGSYFGYFYKLNLNFIPSAMQLAIGSLGFLIFVIFFFQELLNLKKHLPILSKLFTGSILFLLIILSFYLGILYIENYYYSSIIFNIINIFIPFYVSTILFTLYYLVYKKIDKMIKWYALIWTLIGITGLFLMAMHLNFISTSLNVDYYFQMAMLLESSLFSTILASNIINLQKERIKQEKTLVQQSKFADMGKMITAIAHQWRQPLSEINGVVLNIDIDHRKNRLDTPRIEKYLDNIEGTTAHLSKTIDNFMNFFRHDKDIETFMLSSVLEETINLLLNRHVEKYSILYCNEDDMEVYSYKSELIQALLIVLNNSMDVLTLQNISNPTIKIKIEDAEKKVCIVIEDNGGGIPLEIKDKVYEPYFTTKHESQGTGLGLYILKILIEKSMQGTIEQINTEDGLKTSLCIPKTISST